MRVQVQSLAEVLLSQARNLRCRSTLVASSTAISTGEASYINPPETDHDAPVGRTSLSPCRWSLVDPTKRVFFMATPMLGVLLLRYAPNEIPPTEVPIELRTFYNKEVWNARLPAVIRKASRYYKRKFELAWFLIFLAAMIAVPIALYYVSLKFLPESAAEKSFYASNPGGLYYWGWHRGFDRVWKARTISFCSWIAVALLYYIPIAVWKNAGRKSVNNMLRGWENEDRAARATDVPVWRLRYIGIFSTMVKIEIYYPITPENSSFHASAFLPTYIVNAPADPYYPYPVSASVIVNSQVPTSERLTAIPLYDENRGYASPRHGV